MIKLKKCLDEYPFTNSACVEDSPIVEETDIIEKAIANSNGHLLLHLNRNGKRFVSSEKIPEKYRSNIESILEHLTGKTLKQALEMEI